MPAGSPRPRPGQAGRTGPARARAPRPDYPAHWEADIALRDGTAAHLRPILATDAERLQRFHRAQSEQSRYLRFFAPMPELSPRELERFTVVDHRDRVALVVLIGEDIVAVGRYDRLPEDPREAEVAFNVSDHYQGKGLGSVLLEHLAAAARERGIHTFVAEVLPQNHRMISVFTDAGFDVRRSYDDGVVQVDFGIDPTQRSIAVMGEREHRAEARAMERLLHPGSILVVGVSARGDSVGGRVLGALEASGYAGAVHVVSANAFEVGGRPASARIADVPGPVDLAVISVRPADCAQAVRECAGIGVRDLLIVSDGFTEGGAAGARAQREVVALARRHGMRLLGPAAFGFLRTGEDAVNVSLAPRLPSPGATALAGQSGALAAMLLAGADARGIGVREFVGAGNRADVSLNDCLQHWEDDDSVRLIGLGLESMGNPRKFSRIARRLTRRVPVVVLRPPARGSSAPPGHDVRASRLPRRALDQVLESAGVIGTRSMDHLLDVLAFLDREGVPSGTRVGLLSNSPALGSTLRGAADAAGWDVVADHRTATLLDDERLVQRAFTALAAPGGVDLVIAAVLDPLVTDLVEMVRELAEVAHGSAVQLAVCVVTDHDRYEALQRAVREDHRLPPVHPTPVLAVRAAAGAIDHVRRPAHEDGPPLVREDVRPAEAQELIDAALEGAGEGEVELDAEATARLLALYGLDVLPSRLVHDDDQALAAAEELGYPVVLKSSDPSLAHRPDLGAVRLDIADAAQLRGALAGMRRDIPYSRAPLRVQPMAAPGVPVVVRSTEDPSLGPVVNFSLSGEASELHDDVAYAIPPFAPGAARRLVARPVGASRLRGGAGLPGADVEALEEILVRVGLLAEDLPELASLALHPVIVAREGATIVGARAVLAHAPNRTDGLRRSLPAGATAGLAGDAAGTSEASGLRARMRR